MPSRVVLFMIAKYLSGELDGPKFAIPREDNDGSTEIKVFEIKDGLYKKVFFGSDDPKKPRLSE